MFNKKYSDFEFQLCCASCGVFCCVVCGCDGRFSSKREAERRRGQRAEASRTPTPRQHRPTCSPANAMWQSATNAFAGATANCRAVRRTPRRTTPASGGRGHGCFRGPARTDRRGSPATAVSTGGIFGATRVGIGNGRAPLASGAGLFIINKNKFLLISSGLPN